AQVVVAGVLLLPLYLWQLSLAGVHPGLFLRRLVLPAVVSALLYGGSVVLVTHLGSGVLAVGSAGALGLLAIGAMFAREPAVVGVVRTRVRGRRAVAGAGA